LRCDFVFRAVLDGAAGKEHALTFREANFQEQEGVINVSFANDAGVQVLDKTEPDAEVKGRQANERRPGDEARLRQVAVRFLVTPDVSPEATPSAAPVSQADAPRSRGHDDSGLLRLLLD